MRFRGFLAVLLAVLFAASAEGGLSAERRSHAAGPDRVRQAATGAPAVDRAALDRRLRRAQPDWPAFRRREIDCRQVKCVALTFDDGPGAHTGRLLDILAEHDARATFFVVGRRITEWNVPLLHRMVGEGHDLGNHSWSHRLLPRLPAAGVRRQLLRTQQVVEEATGVVMRFMRPPYGATDAKVTAAARRAGLAQILWNVDTWDWRDRKPAVVRRRALRAGPGSIVLLHDIHPTTVRAVPELVRRLHARGFALVTLSELFGERVPVPGRRYRRL